MTGKVDITTPQNAVALGQMLGQAEAWENERDLDLLLGQEVTLVITYRFAVSGTLAQSSNSIGWQLDKSTSHVELWVNDVAWVEVENNLVFLNIA